MLDEFFCLWLWRAICGFWRGLCVVEIGNVASETCGYGQSNNMVSHATINLHIS